MKWTKEQQHAIELPVSDLIVSAAAGSGKTAVMAERIMKRLISDDGVDIDKILIVTYTSAAASEIKERIMKKIMEEISSDSDNERLSSQLIKLPYAHISTIHGFCLELIRKYFYILGIDPAFKIADESEVELLKRNAADSVFSKLYEDHDESFINLVTNYTEKGDNALKESVIELYDFSRTVPDPEKWLDSLKESYLGDCSAAKNYLCESAQLVGEIALCEYSNAIDLCADDPECIILKNFLQKEHDALLYALNQNDYDSMHSALTKMEFPNWRDAKGEKEIREKCKIKRDSAKKIITSDIMSKYMMYTSKEIERDNSNTLPHILTLVDLTKQFAAEFEAMKRDSNVIDFGDFEHLALKILRNDDGTPSDIAHSVSECFEEIYIDEYQDCNNIQNTIFNYISGQFRGKPNVFCVGDMKQSIYRFRDSNPLLFKSKCDSYPLYSGDEINLYNKILLSSNFRSRKSVLNCVNSVFTQIMSVKCGELEYTNEEALNYGSDFEDVNHDTDFVDIDLIDKNNGFSSTTADFGNSPLADTEAEAVLVANKIKNYIDNGYLLFDRKKGETRPAKYSDIVVLLRSTKTPAPIFEKVFNEMGIPVYNDRGNGYFESVEIKLILSLLKIVDNPDDDIALVAVMKSPLFGFDENMLLKIRLNARDVSYYECIKCYAKTNADDIAEKIRHFLELLDKYYKKSRYMDTAEFLSYLITDMGIFNYLSTFSDCKLKKTNVRFLLRKAKEFEKNNFRGIYSFIKYIERFKEKEDISGAKILSENDNVVRIMSIHKSKGLEFPIVFVSCLGKKFNKKDISRKFVMHSQYGIGADSIYRDESASFKTINKLAIKTKLSYEVQSEELRVLYVALTRATEKLVITACIDNAAQKLRDIQQTMVFENEKIRPYHIFSAPNFISIILMALARSEGFDCGLMYNGDNVIKDGCKYKFNGVNISSVREQKTIVLPKDWQRMFDEVTDNYDAVINNLNYQYPHSDAFSIPSNMTVTELKKLTIENEDVYNPFDEVSLAKPSQFGFKNNLHGASLGSLVHFIMEKIDFSGEHEISDIENQLRKMTENNIITSDEAKAIDVNKIYMFFNSETGKDMCKNICSLQREFSFKYLADANEIFDSASNEKIVVQGTIDAFYEDDDGKIVIVDYKTDKVIDGDVQIISERYHSQLDYYAVALQKAVGKPVKKKVLYLFDVNETVEV